MNPIKRLPAPPTSPVAQGKPGRRFSIYIGFYIALSILLLVTGAGWGQSNGWKWLTGGQLRAMKFLNPNEGWVVGHQGLVLHTTDSGRSWDIQEGVTTNDLYDVSFGDDRHGWAVGAWKTIIRTSDGGANWELEAPPPGCDGPYYGVFFDDSNHGWITTSIDTILKTTDGGNTWTYHQAETLSVFFQGIDFLDTLQGIAVGGYRVAKTTDGGITWNVRSNGIGASFIEIDQLDTLNGYASAGGGIVAKTTDGGNSWIRYQTATNVELYGVSFNDATYGWAVGGDGPTSRGAVVGTTDGGVNWIVINGLTSDNAFYGVQALSRTYVKVAGTGGSILETTDGGLNWYILHNSDIGNTSLLNSTFIDSNRGWAVGTNGVITHTVNGGTVWRRQVSGTFSFLYGVSFADSQYGKICTDGGGVLGTRNGGNTWAGESTGATSPLWSIDYPDTSFAVAVGGYYGPYDSSTVRQFDGSTVTEVPLVKRLEMLKQVQHDEEKGIRNDTLPLKETSLDHCKRQGRQEGANPTTAYRTITRTTNGGATWIAQNTSANPLYGVKFITRDHGWACGDGGTVLHTTDLGATWQTQTTGVTNGLYWITFKDTLHGWTCGSGGRVLWTTDGGNAWNTGNSGVTQYLNSIAFADTLTGFAVSDNGLIIRSTDGGRNWIPDTSKCYANFPSVFALDSTHVWTVGSFGMVLGWGEAGNTGIETRGQGEGETRRQETALGQSYPNPTRGIASFDFELAQAEKVRVRVYNVAGQAVRTLVEGQEPAGKHAVSWDGRDDSGRKAGSGTYFYCLEAGDRKAVRKLIVIR